MRKKIIRITLIFFSLLFIVFAIYGGVWFFVPYKIIDIYRGQDERTIWAEIKFFGIQREISGTYSYKSPNVHWSPNKRYFSFSDFVREEIYDKEWFIKIVDLRTLKVKTIFIGINKTSMHQWIDNDTVRVYISAGTGVRIYRDIDINIAEPFIAINYMDPKYWVPEKTY